MGEQLHRRKFVMDDCPFSPDACWWDHSDKKSNDSVSINCFICGSSFKTKNEMMNHRKSNHLKVVKPCEKFNQNICQFKSDSCWYLHGTEKVNVEDVIEEEDMEEDIEEVDNNEFQQSVFQKVTRNLKPPIRNTKKKQKME